jgi:hypothetical protein
VQSNGTVVAWGGNDHGQINVPQNLSNAVATDASWYQSAALKADGTVATWGQTYGAPPSDLTNATAVAAGVGHVLALRTDGKVAAWGDNTYGQCDVPAGLAGVQAVVAGFFHSAGLLSNGTVAVWGLNGAGVGWDITNVPAGLGSVTAVAAGAYHTLALKADGTVAAWGAGKGTDLMFSHGQSIVPGGLSNVVAITAGGFHSMALTRDGSITVWGDMAGPPWGQGSFVAIGSGEQHGLALRGGRLAPWLLLQPVNRAVLPGGNVSLNAWGLGLAGVHYQWQHNGVSIAGATNATLTLTGVEAADGGTYQAIVSTGAGSVTTSPATVALVGLPQVVSTAPPADKTDCVETAPATLSVVAAADGQEQFPLKYHWQFNGTNITNATSSSIAISALTPASEGDYTVTVTNGLLVRLGGRRSRPDGRAAGVDQR